MPNTIKDLPTQITECLANLRLAREIQDKDEVEKQEFLLDFLMDQRTL